MLTRLKKSEKTLAHTALTMFVGSWLILFCQTCFGALQAADLTSFTLSESDHPCHTIDNTTEKAGTADNHCLGVCDCDSVATTLNCFENKENPKKSQIIPLDAIAETVSIVYQTTSGFSNLALVPPERAVLLPLHHYTVLLN